MGASASTGNVPASTSLSTTILVNVKDIKGHQLPNDGILKRFKKFYFIIDGQLKHKIGLAKGNTIALWIDSFYFDALSSSVLECRVYAKHKIGSDDFLGVTKEAIELLLAKGAAGVVTRELCKYDVLGNQRKTQIITEFAIDTPSVAGIPVEASPPNSVTFTPSLTLREHTDWVWCAVFSPDGKYIASGSEDHALMVWDVRRGKLALGPLNKRAAGVNCVAFSPNATRIASGFSDNTILVWHGPMRDHTGPIFSVKFSSSGNQIASGSYDLTIRVWDAHTGDLLVGPLPGHTDTITSLAFSGDGGLLASGSDDKTIRISDTESGRLIHGPLVHQDRVWFLAFTSNGNRIVSASLYGDVCVWNSDTGALVSGPSKRHAEATLAVVLIPNSTFACAVSPDGKWIAGLPMGSGENIVQLWDSKTGRLHATLSDHTEHITSVSFSPDSTRIISTSWDKTIRIYNLRS